jgi:DNA replication protein DnaC
MRMKDLHADLQSNLKALLLHAMTETYQSLAEDFDKKPTKTYIDYLNELCLQEIERRSNKRIERLVKLALLPRSKSLNDFEINRIAGLSPALIQRLAAGTFIDQAENILIFGNPGTGKTHLCIALAREWCFQGRKIRFTTASNLVQELLNAQVQFKLHEAIKKLDAFEVLMIDDISYVPFERQETDVLFQLLAARYEMRSVVITSNLPFAKWGQIFKDEMTTAACIDRLIHHGEILELNAPSYRMDHAKKQARKKPESHLGKDPKS